MESQSKQSATLFDLLDFDDIFASDFFPHEVDFSNLVWDNEHQPISSSSSTNFESSPSGNTVVNDVLSVNIESNQPNVVQIPPLVMSQRDVYIPIVKRKGSSSKGNSKDKSGLCIYSASDNTTELGCDDSDNDECGTVKKARLFEYDALMDGLGNRRERNREHAKQSRSRKKVLLDVLSQQLTVLREQNARLRSIVQENLPPTVAVQIISDCTAQGTLLLGASGVEDGGGEIKSADCSVNSTKSLKRASVSKNTVQHSLMQTDYRLIQSLVVSQQNFILTDPSLPDNPIVYASDGFCKLTGYKRGDILGRNCRFLQGPGTDQVAVGLIRQGIQEDRDVSVCLLNYKADGSPFWNQFFLGALKDSDNRVVNFVGVQCEVNIVPVTELKDKVKRLPIS